MIEIKDKNLFGKVIADALVAIDSKTHLQVWEKERWKNALVKAVVQIEDYGVFMDWQEEKQTLLIWSDRSNNIYEANGECSCEAFLRGYPCWHRTCARIIKNYLDALKGTVEVPLSQGKVAIIDADDADRAYDAKAKELHGDFAVLNFPEENPPPARPGATAAEMNAAPYFKKSLAASAAPQKLGNIRI